jgi:hypothetical protein
VCNSIDALAYARTQLADPTGLPLSIEKCLHTHDALPPWRLERVVSARDLFALVAVDRARVLAHEGTSVVVLRLFELLPRHPVVTVTSVMKLMKTTKPTAGRAIELLVGAGLPQCASAIRSACLSGSS